MKGMEGVHYLQVPHPRRGMHRRYTRLVCHINFGADSVDTSTSIPEMLPTAPSALTMCRRTKREVP